MFWVRWSNQRVVHLTLKYHIWYFLLRCFSPWIALLPNENAKGWYECLWMVREGVVGFSSVIDIYSRCRLQFIYLFNIFHNCELVPSSGRWYSWGGLSAFQPVEVNGKWRCLWCAIRPSFCGRVAFQLVFTKAVVVVTLYSAGCRHGRSAT